jgi:hypothetical protein
MCFNTGKECTVDYVKTTTFEQKDEDWLKIKKLEDAKNRMKSGRKLSYDENEFLKIHALDLHEKAMKIEKERGEFRYALANCKTKQEAMRVKISKFMELQMETNSRDDLEIITMRMMAMLDEFSNYAKITHLFSS